MKVLKDILYKVKLKEIIGSTDIIISNVQFDSRKVGSGDVFVAVKGFSSDGHDFIDQATEKGVVAIVLEDLPAKRSDNVNYIVVEDSSEALGIIAANYYDNPSEKLKLVGVTGTNGKSTTVTLLYRLFTKLGQKTGLLSTITNIIGNNSIAATHTTPDPISLNALLARMVEEECTYAFMEVSSHAIHQNRIAGIHFSGGIFTNLSHDHLDYHKTFSDYIKAKKKFFDNLPEDAFALINKDDANGIVMLQNCDAKKVSYSLSAMADFKAKVIENSISGIHLEIDGNQVYTQLVGRFNAYNVLVVYATARLLGMDPLEILTVLSGLKTAEGRFDLVQSKGTVTSIVDYAHTPDALKNVLETIREVRNGNENIITVVGCGGDRDKSKRPIMAKIACDLSDQVVFTSDNPRSEDPLAIIEDMKKGLDPTHFKKYLIISDRAEAIKTAGSIAGSGDIILIAGKGHEKYQEIKGERFPFDDKEQIENVLKMMEK
jgi:UDP-N-acetylmuramoyl-L-alanyl-D-glutamate--2,6-diaminopimelate ligase